MASVPYHLDDGSGAVLSLQYANENRDRIHEVEADRRTNVDSGLLEYRSRVETFDNTSQTIYCLYEAQLYPQNSWDIGAILSELSAEEEAFVLPAIDAFEEVQDEWEEDGKAVKWYKEPEVDKVLSAINNVDFGQPVPKVGGEILSSLITEHPLPNANHRVALSFLEMYLSMYDSDFEMPRTGVTGEWSDWARDYVYKSKRIMTLARKTGLLRTLQDYSFDEVVRDGDNVIEFEDHDLTRSNYTDYYKYEVHLDESIGFVHGVLDRTDNPHLLNMEDEGRDTFIERLSA